jgi:hypothetical protein
LAVRGITSITSTSDPTDGEIDGQSVIGEGTFTRTDGTIGTYVEVTLDAVFGAEVETASPRTFVVDDLNMVELIPDYDFDKGDRVDISTLLESNFGRESDNVGDFVRLEANGDDLTLQVDVDGTDTNHAWTDVATLPGLGAVTEVVKVIFTSDNETNISNEG